jgi:hypothetical protein
MSKKRKLWRKIFLRVRATSRLRDEFTPLTPRESVMQSVTRMTEEKADVILIKQQLCKVEKELEIEREACSRQTKSSSRQVKELSEDVRRLEVPSLAPNTVSLCTASSIDSFLEPLRCRCTADPTC